MDIYKYKMQQLTTQIELKENLSDLSGLESKGNIQRDKLLKTCKDTEELFSLSTETNPNSLIKTTEDFMHQCLLFEKGGDYHPKEIEDIREGIEQWKNGLNETIADRKAMIDNLHMQVEAALTDFKIFQEEISKRNLYLCVRDGLGLKYGEPRRIFQEKYSTEIAK